MAFVPMAELSMMQRNEEAVVDIIFVGDPIEQNLRDWEESFGHPCWFEASLPKRFSKAQSLYYKYHNHSYRDSPGDIVNHAAHALLSEWAKLEKRSPVRLLTDPLENAVDRMNGTSRPVLFVCQSLGGRVVEQALLLSQSQDEMHVLSRKTFGIFIGSPHASSAHMSIISVHERPDRLKHTHSTPQTRQPAEIDQRSARLTPDDHRPDRPYIRVYFCKETSIPCPRAKVIHHDCLWSMVPQSWLSDNAEKHYVIPKTLPQDITRANVERSISCLSEEAARSQDECRRCLQSQHSLLQMCLRERFPTSCEWLINLQKYREWANEAEKPLLWLKGLPGAGKSTLCSAIANNLQERQEQGCATAFFFFDFRHGQNNLGKYILEAFAYQLRDYMEPIVLQRLSVSTIGEGESITDPPPLEQFQRNLRAIFVSVVSHAQVFFILDGLDDDGGVKKVIMHEVLRANRWRKKSHIFRCALSSRFACEARIDPEDMIQIDLRTETGHQQDLLKFATFRLANIIRTSSKQTASVLDLAKRLCCRANGSFLWLALAIEAIQRTQLRPNMLQLVNQLPVNINTFYQMALQQIPLRDVETAQKIFSWLTVANRLLYLPELLEALTVRADHFQLSEQSPSTGNELSTPNTEAEIHRICGWLVNITEEGIVRLRHPTLRDYLFCADESSNHSRHPILAAHELLARACLILLSSVIRLEPSSASTNTKPGVTSTLTRYAAANWSVHYRLSETYSRVLAGTLQRCLVITLEYDCQSFSLPNYARSIHIANTILRISASFGLISLTQLCLEMGTDPRAGSCIICETPFAIAAGGGHSEAANIILQGTALPASRLNYNAEDMIHLAITQGLTDAAKSLLESGAKVDAIDHASEKTLLHVAAESGRLDLVKLLMGYNANVNAIIPTTQETPLHLAAVHGYTHVVKYLIDGRDPSMMELELYNSIVQQPYYQSWTEDLLMNEERPKSIVWEVDARDSAEEQIGRLRSCSTRYSNINLRTSQGRTALDLAASNGYNDVVRFLLERGANLESEWKDPCTAIQAAVENGHLETVQLLFAAGADMDHQNKRLVSTLQYACEKGRDDVADFVVWHCFNAEFSNEKFPWQVLCLPTKTTKTVVRDAIQKKKLQTKLSKLGTHNRIAQRLSKLAERPKV